VRCFKLGKIAAHISKEGVATETRLNSPKSTIICKRSHLFSSRSDREHARALGTLPNAALLRVLSIFGSDSRGYIYQDGPEAGGATDLMIDRVEARLDQIICQGEINFAA